MERWRCHVWVRPSSLGTPATLQPQAPPPQSIFSGAAGGNAKFVTPGLGRVWSLGWWFRMELLTDPSISYFATQP